MENLIIPLFPSITLSLLSPFLVLYRRSLDTLQVLATVGEPINPEAWLWYYRSVGHDKCSVVDTYWQTETVSQL